MWGDWTGDRLTCLQDSSSVTHLYKANTHTLLQRTNWNAPRRAQTLQMFGDLTGDRVTYLQDSDFCIQYKASTHYYKELTWLYVGHGWLCESKPKTCSLYSNQANILLSGAHLNGQGLAWTGTLSCLHCVICGGNGRATAWPAFRTRWQGYRSTLSCWELTRMLLLLYGTAWRRRIKTNSCCMHIIPQRPSCLECCAVA